MDSILRITTPCELRVCQLNFRLKYLIIWGIAGLNGVSQCASAISALANVNSQQVIPAALIPTSQRTF